LRPSSLTPGLALPTAVVWVLPSHEFCFVIVAAKHFALEYRMPTASHP
jgi:hypothetical protein